MEKTTLEIPDQNLVEKITRIGVETELSKFPIHNLAKTGSVNIQILKEAPDGQIQLKWEVSYNARFGQPRQLAYKIDTLVINRRIDEARRPLPKFIKLGSLREIGAELDIESTNKVKQALLQNASAFIVAKIKCKLINGTERWLEAGFTRYTVIFTGEKLPDGRVADAVYIELHPRFQETLNNAPIRPLNYEYLKILPPAAQRFYEIISLRVFAALKNKNPFARILYSDFCTYSALTRHFDYESFRVQMAKIHRPHLKSGYLAKIQYEEVSDGEGKTDWMMSYEPGAKAGAEYHVFTQKEQASGFDALPPMLAKHDNPLLAEITRRGITEKRARTLLQNLVEGQQIMDQLEWGDYLVAQSTGAFHNPPGFLISLIEQNVPVPENFETSKKRKLREEVRQIREKQIQEQLRLETAYDEYKRRETDRYIQEHLTDFELEQLQKKKSKQLAAQFKNFALMPTETVNQIVWGAVKAEIAKRVPFLTFTAYCKAQARQPSLF
jgi:hypothetical protein